MIFKRGRAIPRNISRHTISSMILFIPSPPYHGKLHIFHSTYKYVTVKMLKAEVVVR
jgi:hypothetical protein